MDYQEFIKPELLILIPVLYAIGAGIKKSKVNDALIPFILGILGVLLSALYLFSVEDFGEIRAVATAVFTAITQGVLLAAASVYANQVVKQVENIKHEEKER